MKNMNKFKHIICAALCLCMCLGVLAGLVSCDGQSSEPTATEGPKEGEEAVVRINQDINEGTQITEAMLTVDYMLPENIPLNAIRTSERVVGKYATTKLYNGEFFFAGKLSETNPNALGPIAALTDTYIMVNKYVKAGTDVAETLQQLIDANPGRTLYFADGEYVISKPIATHGDPAKGVSLYLSNYAVIKAADNWSSGKTAMVRIGGRGDAADPGIETTRTSLWGGIIDGNGKAVGISLEGGRDSIISNVSVKNTTVGIHLTAGSTGYTHTDIENVNITGTGKDSDVGIIIDSLGNTLTNVRINGTGTGVKITDGANHNVLRNIHAVYSGKSENSNGFYDLSTGSTYDMCFSEQYAVGFYMGEANLSSYNGCYAFWPNNVFERNYAWYAEGKFSSSIRNCRVDFYEKTGDTAFLAIGEEGGTGMILYPVIFGTVNISDTTYTKYLKSKAVQK